MSQTAVPPMSMHASAYALLLFVAAFLPYVSPIPVASDTQPVTLLLGLVGLFLFVPMSERVPATIWMLAIPFLASVLFALEAGFTFSVARNVANYISLFVLSLVFYCVIRRTGFDLSRLLLPITVVWLFIGAIQVLYDRQFATALLGTVRTTEFRGATSLAPEPTFFATVLLFIIFFALTARELRPGIVAACAAGILLVAQSAQITLILFVGLATFTLVWVFSRKIQFWLLLALGSVGVSVYLVLNYLSDTRLISVLKLIVSNPSTLIFVDASANNRASHIWFSVKGSVDNMFLPRGVDPGLWVDYFYQQATARPDLFWFAFPGHQIMSGYGKAIFELGFLSLFIFGAINTALLLRAWPSRALKWSMVMMTNLLLLSAIPLSHPLIPLFIAWLSVDIARDRTSARRALAE